MTISKTGNRLGAPRIGEIRVDTPKNKREREEREYSYIRQEQMRVANERYRARYPHLVKQMNKEARLRKKARDANAGFVDALTIAEATCSVFDNLRIRLPK